MRLFNLRRTAIASLVCLVQSLAFAAELASDPNAAASENIVLAQATTFAEQGAARLQSTLAEQLAEDSRFAHTFGGRGHVALVAPSFVQQAVPVALPAAGATVRSGSSQREPSPWLMGGVVLLLIGYQLRRKHRLLRPHRFSAL